MKVFVAGATGALGQPLVRELVARGHDVRGLSRSEANDEILAKLGAAARRGDLFDSGSLARAAEGCEAVVRAATHIPKGKMTPEEWAQNDRIRREGTRALLAAAREVGARKYVQESVVWLARPDDGSPFDESSVPRPDKITQSALDAERLAADSGLAATTLRFGWFYGGETAHTRHFASLLRARRLPVIGRGDARLSFLHVADAARAIATAVERDAPGVWHVVDDRPTSVADYLDAFAAAIGAPPPRRVPVWLGRLAAGAFTTRFLTTPMVASHDLFTKATGWTPRHATVDEGLREVASELTRT